MAQNQIDKRVRAVRELTALFRLERYVYIGIIVVCLLILLTSIGLAIFSKEGKITSAEISSIFGSGGMISVMTGRLIRMWERSVNLLNSPCTN